MSMWLHFWRHLCELGAPVHRRACSDEALVAAVLYPTSKRDLVVTPVKEEE